MGSMSVAIMAKVPRVGEVKTRLCPPLSAAEATELYRCFLLDKIEQVRMLKKARPALVYTPTEAKSFFEGVAPDFALVPQHGTDLGSRLANGFDQLFAHGYTGVLAIDSDSPTLPTTFLQKAVNLIAKSEIDVVLGPSEDGGYYLIGLRAPQRELFADIAWSTPHVLRETVRRAEAKGLKIACLPRWFDIDNPDDLERLKNSLVRVGGTGPWHTRRFFLERS